MGLENRPIGVFIHGKKVGGTSVRGVLEERVGRNQIAVYVQEADRIVRGTDRLLQTTSPVVDRLRAEAFGNPVLAPALVRLWPTVSRFATRRTIKSYPTLEVPPDVDILTGHFAADKFDALLGEREQITGFVVRDPLDRMISHFLHWNRKRGYEEDWRVEIPFTKKRHHESFEDYFKRFAMLDPLQNYQTEILSGTPITDIDIVGVTEHIGEFTEAFLNKLRQAGIAIPEVEASQQERRFNVTPTKQKLKIDKQNLGEDFLISFRERHALDYELYAQAKSIQQQRMEAGTTP